MTVRYLFTLFALFLLCSCGEKRIAKEMEKFSGQQIILPANLTKLGSEDTLLANLTEVPIKLIVWYDSRDCVLCEATSMYEWDHIAKSVDSLTQWFRMAFIFTPKEENLRQVRISLRPYRFKYNIFVDQSATFSKQNKLPRNRLLHTFLLDKNNKVVLVGNPQRNPSLWRLYKRTIQTMIANDGVLPR